MMEKPFKEGPAKLGETPFSTTTKGIRVRVYPSFNSEASKPSFGVFFYDYTIEITNLGAETAQLVGRHWIIRDGLGGAEHVVGEGVVGEKPTLQPGESFTYRSGCPLKTPTGTMEGTYQMRLASGSVFEALVGRFELKHASLLN